MHRRTLIRGLGAGLALSGLPGMVSGAGRPVRIGLTPVFLDDQMSFLNDWRRYLEAALARPVEFVQRGSYREIVDLTLQDKIQFAWLCGYPYVRHRSRIRLLAVPIYNGLPYYQSYLIVPAPDRETQSVFDLRGRVMAYSDPDSNSGFLYPQYQLLSNSIRPEGFFRRSFFTYGHRNVVEAVAARVAHGGAVDGYVWDTLQRIHPRLVDRTRIADRSPQFGFPPMVASPAVGATEFRRVQSVLLDMHRDAEGRALLSRLNVDRFEISPTSIFDGIERMARTLASAKP